MTVYNLAYSGKSELFRDFFSTSGCNLLCLPDKLLRCSSDWLRQTTGGLDYYSYS